MIRKYADFFCWKNVSSFCSAKATHIFSAKNIRLLYIESAKTVNEMTLNELVKLTTLWTTGPWIPSWTSILFYEIKKPDLSVLPSHNSTLWKQQLQGIHLQATWATCSPFFCRRHSVLTGKRCWRRLNFSVCIAYPDRLIHRKYRRRCHDLSSLEARIIGRQAHSLVIWHFPVKSHRLFADNLI